MISHSRPYITKDDIAAVRKVLESENIAKGAKVFEFEKALAEYIGTKSAFATGSGTAALILGLKALGITENDEVILPTYVCRNVMDAINTIGAKPVFCDIGDEWNMNTETIKPKLTSKTKAIIIVHIFGIPADSKNIKDLGVHVIEDTCQAFGAEANGKILGSESELAMYSFHATKCLTTGEGGALTSNNPKITSRIKELLEKNFIPSPMTDVQAALGISQLRKFRQMLNTRKKIAEKYFKELQMDNVFLPETVKDKSIFFRFPVRIEKLDFENAKKIFFNQGIHVRRGVDSLLHRNLGLDDKKFPCAVKLFGETLSIPIYPALSEEELEKVIENTNKILN
jgi:perosamine synthetase